MNKARTVTKKEKVRCVFCNSLSHNKENCNSNFNGRRKELDEGWDFLIHEFEPRFETMAVNELRYIAWQYGSYEGAIHDWREKTTQQYNRKYKFRPIDLTLPKPLLIKELSRRWKNFQHVRDLAKNKPESTTDNDDCPICFENTSTTYEWSHNIANWIKHDDKHTTKCKHSFCKMCWNTLIEKSHQQHYWVNGGYNKVIVHVSCPLCRQNNEQIMTL